MEAVCYTNKAGSKKYIIESYEPSTAIIEELIQKLEKNLGIKADKAYADSVRNSTIFYHIKINGRTQGSVSFENSKIATTWDLLNLSAVEKLLFLTFVIYRHTKINFVPHGNEHSSFKSLMSPGQKLKFESTGVITISSAYIAKRYLLRGNPSELLGFKECKNG